MNAIGLSLDELDTPFLWTDVELLDANIRTMAAYFRDAGVGWRPHTKGIKTPAIAHKLIAAGALGITCAKMGEAEVMAAAGIREILIANQTVGPHKYARLAALQRQANVKAAVDDASVLPGLGAAAQAAGVEIGLLVEVNGGMNRAGTEPGEATVELAHQLHNTPGLRLDGLMAWEGHTLALPDAERAAAIHKAVGLLLSSVEACRSVGLPVSIVSCGGSGTMTVTAHIAGITEMQAGGAIFGDATYQRWHAPTRPALFVRTVVASRPAPDRIIVDAGWKTLPAWIGQPVPVGVEGVVKFAASAEHGIVTLDRANDSLRVGDFLDFVVGYGDNTVFLHDEIVGVRGGRVEAVWPVSARGKLT
ncbi:MAG: DSD1 family PLP-dependent enzyme [Chloroflexi bacterium]|nr:MAG: DSD1 family PLP-dependent enzyme [Chloroflexota bacterium]